MSIIRNHNLLATSQMRRQALEIIEAGIRRVLPDNILYSSVSYDAASRTLRVNDDAFTITGRIFVIGGGKASGLMAATLEDIVGVSNITAGTVNFKGGEAKTKNIELVTAGHPLPDVRGVAGVDSILSLKQRYNINKDDVVVCLISGGGSALMPAPVDGVSLEDIQQLTQLLLSSGVAIGEINITRKHLSRVKGGRLGAYFAPARVVSLILSDVIGNHLATIASGPTCPDPSTFADAIEVLKRYNLMDKTPQSIIDFLNAGIEGEVAETPKSLENCYNYIIGDNRLALTAMVDKAKELGLKPHIISAEQQGDAKEVAELRAREIIGGRYAGYNALLIGGEVTISLPASTGKGGRNQHYAAVSMAAMSAYPGDWLAASIGSDGSDYIPDVAGAVIDQDSLAEAREMGLDVNTYIENYNSNALLSEIGNSLVVTGDTGTNIGDLALYLLS